MFEKEIVFRKMAYLFLKSNRTNICLYCMHAGVNESFEFTINIEREKRWYNGRIYRQNHRNGMLIERNHKTLSLLTALSVAVFFTLSVLSAHGSRVWHRARIHINIF